MTRCRFAVHLAERAIRRFQTPPSGTSHVSRLHTTTATDAARSELVERPRIGFLVRALLDRLGDTVLVPDAHVGVLVEQDNVEGLVCGTEAGEFVGGEEALGVSVVVELAAGELEGPGEVDAPVAVQVVEARGVADG